MNNDDILAEYLGNNMTIEWALDQAREDEREKIAKEIKELKRAAEKLAALEQHGVDNWDWYGDAMASLNDDD